MKSIIVILLMGLLGGIQFPPSSVQISGNVFDQTTKAPLAGVTVTVKGTKTATSTDYLGRYQLMVVNSQSVIVASAAGFATQEILVGQKTIINFFLVSATHPVADQEVFDYLREETVDMLSGYKKSRTLPGAILFEASRRGTP
jgi:hypothetical protein